MKKIHHVVRQSPRQLKILCSWSPGGGWVEEESMTFGWKKVTCKSCLKKKGDL